MAKADLGKKRNCLSCGARFYDLNREPIVCPKCETELDVAALMRTSRAKPAPPKPEKPKVKAVEATDGDDDDDIDLELDDDDDDFPDHDIDLDDDDDDDDDDLIEDTSELGEDKDDMFEVIDTVEEKTKGDDA